MVRKNGLTEMVLRDGILRHDGKLARVQAKI